MLLGIIYTRFIIMVKGIEITEFEWYLRNRLFRQSNQGRESSKRRTRRRNVEYVF